MNLFLITQDTDVDSNEDYIFKGIYNYEKIISNISKYVAYFYGEFPDGKYVKLTEDILNSLDDRWHSFIAFDIPVNDENDLFFDSLFINGPPDDWAENVVGYNLIRVGSNSSGAVGNIQV